MKKYIGNQKNWNVIVYLFSMMGSAVFYKILDKTQILDAFLNLLKTLIIKALKFLVKVILGRKAKIVF